MTKWLSLAAFLACLGSASAQTLGPQPVGILPTPFSVGGVSVTSTGTQLNYLSAATGTTGTTSTNVVFSTSPTLVTPTLGAATVTTINGYTFNTTTGTTAFSFGANASLTIAAAKAATINNTLTFTGTDGITAAFGGGLTITAGKSLSVSNTLTLAGTDSSSVNVGSGGTFVPHPPQGRLTLTTATPVMIATASAQTTVYYTPYIGSLIPIYDGTSWQMVSFAEVSQATSDTTKSPAAVAASSVYDVFCWVDSGTNRCTRGPVWTNTTTRSAGTALVRQNGIYLNNATITNGPAASRGTYVGSIASNAGSTIDYIFGAAASGGTAAVLNVWNNYNRVSVGTTVIDNGATFTYTSSTIQQYRASAGNQVTVLSGLQEDQLNVSVSGETTTAAALSAAADLGPGLDSTTTYVNSNSCRTRFVSEIVAGSTGALAISCVISPALGVHVVSLNQSSDNTNANTYNVIGAALNVLARQ